LDFNITAPTNQKAMSRKIIIKEILQAGRMAVKPIFGDIDGFKVADDNPKQPVYYLNTDDNERE